MLNNLSNTVTVILASFGIISIIGIILLIVYINNKNKDKLFNNKSKNIYSIGLENMNENYNINKEKTVDIQMALATDAIPFLDDIKFPEPILPTSNNTPLEIRIPRGDEKDIDMQMQLATNDIPNLDDMDFPVYVDEVHDHLLDDRNLVMEMPDASKIEVEINNLDELREVANGGFIDNLEIDEELEEIQDNKNKTSIEEVLKAMQVDLEKQKYAKIDAYEEEQEEEAVISYQQLKEKMAMKEQNKREEKLDALMKQTRELNIDDYLSYNRPKEVEKEPVYKDLMGEKTDYSSYFFDILDRNEPVTKKEEKVEQLDYYNEGPLHFEEKNTVIDEVYEPVKPKQNIEYSTDYISPVFGKQKPNIVYNDLTKIRNSRSKRQEINTNYDETDNFLNTLKEFRNNL